MTTMQAPATYSKVQGRSGAVYTPDASGVITSVAWEDVYGLQGLGLTVTNTLGGGSAGLASEGPVNRQISATGISPGATGADNVLAAYSIPASSFDIAGRGISIKAAGSFAATANNKRIKIIFNPATATVGSTVGTGGTTIADTGTVATNGAGWSLLAEVYKYGAAASNTQIGFHTGGQCGSATPALLVPATATATESGAILIAVTGNATTAASDIVLNFVKINAID